MRFVFNPTVLFVIGISLVLFGCQNKPYEYTDPDHHVSVSYPGTVDLFKDKKVLRQHLEQESSTDQAIDQPELLFILTTLNQSRLTCAVHHLPDDHKLSAEEYYQVSTAAELEALKVNIVEPKSDVTIGDKAFKRVGFTLKTGDQVVRSSIYQYLDSDSGKVLVLSATALAPKWEQEQPVLEGMIRSTRLNW